MSMPSTRSTSSSSTIRSTSVDMRDGVPPPPRQVLAHDREQLEHHLAVVEVCRRHFFQDPVDDLEATAVPLLGDLRIVEIGGRPPGRARLQFARGDSRCRRHGRLYQPVSARRSELRVPRRFVRRSCPKLVPGDSRTR